MLRTMTLLATMLPIGGVLAQAPFTIVRPAEGAKVREVVEILLPKGSIPRGGFIGVSVDGKFIEARVPTFDEKRGFYVYQLDTKARGIKDGDRTISVNLYANVRGKPVIADRSEVRVRVANHEGITVPKEGLLLRYKFHPGRELYYQIETGLFVSTWTDARSRLGGRATEIPISTRQIRLLQVVDNVKPDGTAVVRYQVVPKPGKDYVVATLRGSTQPEKVPLAELAPFYRLMNPLGREVYADVPYWVGAQERSGNFRGVYHILPTPELPEDRVQVGDVWQGALLFVIEPEDPSMDPLDYIIQTGKSVDRVQARGALVSVEWEQGKPCAKIRYEIEYGVPERVQRILRVMDQEFRGDHRLRYEQTVWLSLDDGLLVRNELVVEADFRQEEAPAGGPGAGPGGGAPTPGGRERPAVAGGGGGSGATGVGMVAPQGRERPQIGGVTPGARMGGGPGGMGQGTRGDARFVRQKFYYKMILERR
ncbi:MAG: hypothetical protein K6T17_02355 [Fimbriimonadales bacterium]|nr:hypothetical protein [Fimbriimonadales bacterium]